MGWDTGLADRIRAKGVRVVEVDGWKTRGSTTYSPQLALWHHTAGSASGTAPSLAVCIYGRPGLPGPLCNVLQSREPNGDDIAYVIAAGRANHAGVGTWRGISGNSRAFGLEVEHTGTSTQPGRRHEISARILAAGLEAGSRDARNCCRHAEYATPAGRKIDFNVAVSPWTAAEMRSRVGYWIGRTTTTAPAQEDTFMSGLTEAQQKEMYRQICGDPSESRLGEVAKAVRDLKQPPGYFAKAGDDGTVYYVDAAHQSKVPMQVGGDLHEWLKALHRISGFNERAVVMDQLVLDAIPNAGF